ncbi:MAG: hypothetical protein WCX65_17125 [bacterium]
MIFVLSAASGCSLNPFAKKDTLPQMNNITPGQRVTGVRGVATPGSTPALVMTGGKDYATGTVSADAESGKQTPPDLIKESGFDMIYPNFNKETGRQDPFVPVSMNAGPLEVLRQMTPEKFRVIGTAMTPTGQIALIEVGGQTLTVREGDVLESGHVVKSITKYEVTLEKEAQQVRLTMFTRKRIAEPAAEKNYPKLPGMNINDQYVSYLKDKYGEDVEGKVGETKRPASFNEFIGKSEEDLAKEVLSGDN